MLNRNSDAYRRSRKRSFLYFVFSRSHRPRWHNFRDHAERRSLQQRRRRSALHLA